MSGLKINTATISICIGLILLVSCDAPAKRKQFKLDPEIAKIIGENLVSWLQKAPFDNELKRYDEDKIILTNATQVFPFMGRYYSSIEELRRESDLTADTMIFHTSELLFQDSVWGDLFLHGTLLYDDQEVFLSDSYIETGSPFFGGTDAVMDLHRASLYETSIFAKHPHYKTGIYYVYSNFAPYLLGFYQQGQLVFETAIPILRGDTLATLDKLKEVSDKLGLHIPEWENAKPYQLREVEEPNSFWKDPFIGIYKSQYVINDVYLKIKGTSFTQIDPAPKGDYYFSYTSANGPVELYTVTQKTELDEESFNKENKKLESYRYFYRDIFYEEKTEGNDILGIAKSYFKEHHYLELHYRYPKTDNDAREQVHEVLKYVKILGQR